MDMILTGRPVGAKEAFDWGLANRVVAPGKEREEAEKLATTLCNFPQATMRSDRRSMLEQWTLPMKQALQNEFAHGSTVLKDSVVGASKFAQGKGRGGSFADFEAESKL